jgi:hypothetical protein
MHVLLLFPVDLPSHSLHGLSPHGRRDTGYLVYIRNREQVPAGQGGNVNRAINSESNVGIKTTITYMVG